LSFAPSLKQTHAEPPWRRPRDFLVIVPAVLAQPPRGLRDEAAIGAAQVPIDPVGVVGRAVNDRRRIAAAFQRLVEFELR
jgi:hypothetical protein